MNLIQNAITQQAAGWFQAQRKRMFDFRTLCWVFLETYASDEIIKEQKERLIRTDIRWDLIPSFEIKCIY